MPKNSRSELSNIWKLVITSTAICLLALILVACGDATNTTANITSLPTVTAAVTPVLGDTATSTPTTDNTASPVPATPTNVATTVTAATTPVPASASPTPTTKNDGENEAETPEPGTIVEIEGPVEQIINNTTIIIYGHKYMLDPTYVTSLGPQLVVGVLLHFKAKFKDDGSYLLVAPAQVVTAPVAGSIVEVEGPVTQIVNNVIIVYNQRYVLEPNYIATLGSQLAVGKYLHFKAKYGDNETFLVISPVAVVTAPVVAVVQGSGNIAPPPAPVVVVKCDGKSKGKGCEDHPPKGPKK